MYRNGKYTFMVWNTSHNEAIQLSIIDTSEASARSAASNLMYNLPNSSTYNTGSLRLVAYEDIPQPQNNPTVNNASNYNIESYLSQIKNDISEINKRGKEAKF